MITVERFNDDRIPDAFDGRFQFVLVANSKTLRHRDAHVTEQFFRRVLIRGDIDCDHIGIRGSRRLNSFLVYAIPKLNQRLIVQPDKRNITAYRFLHQRSGRRPKTAHLRESQHFLKDTGDAFLYVVNTLPSARSRKSCTIPPGKLPDSSSW